MNPNNHGFIPSKIEADHYIHGDGKLGDKAILTDGQWDSWIPIAEDQNLGMEPEACTTFAITNAVETLIAQKYGEVDVFSKRFLAYISGTTQSGNDPHTVAETLRLKGDCLESDYPYTADINTWEKFYAAPAQFLYSKALLFLSKFNYGHSWVTDTSQQGLMNALNFSPLTAAVFAWAQDPQTGDYITPPGAEPCHYVEIYGYERNYYWKIWDSYTQEAKKLAWDFPFVQVKRHTITKDSLQQAIPVWQQILAQITTLLNNLSEQVHVTLGLGDYARNFGATRSPQWPGVRAAHLKKEPACKLCGSTKSLQVHHIRPFHIHPELELDDTNLITLCTGNNTINCHVRFGHLDNFKDKWNPNIREDCVMWKARFDAVKEQEVFPLEVETQV